VNKPESRCQGVIPVKFLPHFVAVLSLASTLASPGFAQSAGKDVFSSKCAPCHGTDGLAATPIGRALKAASFKSPAAVKASDAELIAIVHSGKNKMPSFQGKLGDDQIKAVVAYIRTLQK
jgi:mono/diheme cytochrome c family protein